MKSNKMKLSVALLLCFMISVSILPMQVFAGGGEEQEEPVITKIIEKEEKSEEKDIEIRLPNKLTAKEPPQNISEENEKKSNNKGTASAPSKATATLTENVDNKNAAYPIYHGEDKESESNKYAADARQFITFKTKSGKTFHLIINHDEETENVMLLTEVSEDDLLNFVEVKEKIEPVKEVIKEEPVKEEVKPEKTEKSDLGTYLLLFLVVIAALGAGYYFKVIKKKEDKELENLEEDDDFFSEAETTEENEQEINNSEVDDSETEETEEL